MLEPGIPDGDSSVDQETGSEDVPSVVILGLGNVLRSDEGLGIRALERLRAHYLLPACVKLVDGGTLGLDLLCYLEQVDRVLILDAVLTQDPPGTVLRMVGPEVPAFLGMRTSSHEVALPDLLALTSLRGTRPRELVFLGMRPEVLELGWELSASVAAHLDQFVDAAVSELRHWGFLITTRDLALDASSIFDDRFDTCSLLKKSESITIQ